MIDGTDLISLETDVRDLIGEETARLWTQARVFRAINSEVMRLARKVIDLDSGYFETSTTLTPSASMDLPVNCYLIRNLEAQISGAWYGLRWIEDNQKGQYQQYGTSSTTAPVAVRFVDSALVLEGSYSGCSSVRIQYARLPAEMRYETLSSGSATTAVMSSGSAIDDVYVGDRFIVLSGTGEGQISTVTDYVASTKTLTIASGATLDSTTVISWLLPEPLSKWPDLVVTGAAIRLLSRRRDMELIESLMQQYLMDVSDMTAALGQRQTDQALRVNYIPDGLE